MHTSSQPRVHLALALHGFATLLAHSVLVSTPTLTKSKETVSERLELAKQPSARQPTSKSS